jgi:soluble lytic murein transglycosylase-like protein
MSDTLLQWEREQKRWWRQLLSHVGAPLRAVLLGALAFAFGIHAASAMGGWAPESLLQKRLRETETTLKARQGELELARMELSRVQNVMKYSAQYRIPADLAAAIYDVALAEGVEPGLAYSLVRVESGFYRGAVSPVGAIGLTQVMPATARDLEPSLRSGDLFHQETNLHLGFRYLRQMLDKYEGDLHLALLAYNRGPGTVDAIRKIGGNPSNGYEHAVIRGQ